MKKMLLFMVASLFAVSCRITGGDSVTIKYPTDLRGHGTKGSTTYNLDFVLGPVRDFRAMYCDWNTLQRRISEGVCILNYDSQGDNHKEIKISAEITLGDLLRKFGNSLKDWKPGLQPTIRIISENAILSDSGKPEFLQTKVVPGDFVIIMRIYE